MCAYDANMAHRARRARQRAREVAAALTAADVGGAESHSLVPRMVHGQPRHRYRVVVDVAISGLR